MLAFFIARAKSPDDKDEPDAGKLYKVSEFKMGKKEPIGGHEAQAIHYRLTVDFRKSESMDVMLWLDAKTNLPLKREIRPLTEQEAGVLNETYSKVTLDGKLDPKLFEL